MVGFEDHKLLVWDVKTDQEPFQVSDDKVCQIKRVMDTNDYIIKSRTEEGKTEGVKLLTIKMDSEQQEKFSLRNLPEAKAEWSNFTDSLQV